MVKKKLFHIQFAVKSLYDEFTAFQIRSTNLPRFKSHACEQSVIAQNSVIITQRDNQMQKTQLHSAVKTPGPDDQKMFIKNVNTQNSTSPQSFNKLILKCDMIPEKVIGHNGYFKEAPVAVNRFVSDHMFFCENDLSLYARLNNYYFSHIARKIDS